MNTFIDWGIQGRGLLKLGDQITQLLPRARALVLVRFSVETLRLRIGRLDAHPHASSPDMGNPESGGGAEWR